MAEYVVVIALGLVSLAAVAFPLIAGRARYHDAAALDTDLRRYRAALDAGTVCARCRAANPVGSRYCAECGEPLRNADSGHAARQPEA